MNNRSFIRILSFLIAAFLVSVGMLIKERNVSHKYRIRIQNEYSRSFSELNSRLGNISTLLEKTLYINGSPQMSSLATELYSEAELAKNALSQLPTGDQTLEIINRFLSQVGNYAISVSKTTALNSEISEEQRNNLMLLSKTANTISSAVADTEINFNNSDYWLSVLEEKIKNSDNEMNLANSLISLEENLTDYPTLIYDGPYSDHILNKAPLMTTNAELFDKNNALSVAQKFLGGNVGDLKFEDMQNGKIECYRFTNDDVTVSVSKKGGFVVYMRKNRPVGDTSLTYNQALAKAKKFMADNKFDDMVDTYYYSDEGVCVINFAYLDGQTICYTDLIKVGVAMDTGEIMLFESGGYLTNHTSRAFNTPEFSEEEAMKSVSTGLTVRKVSMALIPTDGGGEERCYEFACVTPEGQDILVYVNTMTLLNEQIFILQKSDGGTLVK